MFYLDSITPTSFVNSAVDVRISSVPVHFPVVPFPLIFRLIISNQIHQVSWTLKLSIAEASLYQYNSYVLITIILMFSLTLYPEPSGQVMLARPG